MNFKMQDSVVQTKIVSEIQLVYRSKININDRPIIQPSEDANKIFHQVWDEDLMLRESFYAMYLNRQNKVQSVLKVSTGGTTGTVADPRLIRLAVGAMVRDLIKVYHQLLNYGHEWCDPLGNLYEEITSKRKSQALGQFFTPEHLCDLMVQLNYSEVISNARISDPACGSGRNLLAFHVAYPGNYVFGEDIDLMCCKMAAINLMVHGCQGEIIHHNSLVCVNQFQTYPDDVCDNTHH
ncbi:N-6 DNA methylase [Fulvivirga ligni]|uniref:N-6 DNA methylase n=1 Tax=Fulvivirga ligni TaxID=2904246 RepID=UPI001F16451C|nr:N-6 DNA methylase [Fulvivirga ligni]UII21575.1 N-6 DNA methylase [Fulvivirga ligni]